MLESFACKNHTRVQEAEDQEHIGDDMNGTKRIPGVLLALYTD
jgi:nitrate reductase NapAB chaperone NapD